MLLSSAGFSASIAKSLDCMQVRRSANFGASWDSCITLRRNTSHKLHEKRRISMHLILWAQDAPRCQMVIGLEALSCLFRHV